MVDNEDWSKYSFCEEGYINVRKERDLNGFLYEFRERCDSVLSIFKLELYCKISTSRKEFSRRIEHF
jgi:hypothetical protein